MEFGRRGASEGVWPARLQMCLGECPWLEGDSSLSSEAHKPFGVAGLREAEPETKWSVLIWLLTQEADGW